jgi:mRNA interferase RelE/StbE
VASYKVLIKTSAGRELAAVDSKSDRQKLVGRIRGLASNPRSHGAEKLAGYADRYRVRQGNYRIVYLIDNEASIATLFKVGHRNDIYR